MSEVTKILEAIEQGNQDATSQLLPIVYDELRKLAKIRLENERTGHSMQATALVHEAWLRLVGKQGEQTHWNGRGHFFGAAAEAMRRILVDQARKRNAQKRGGDLNRVGLSKIDHPAMQDTERLVAMNEALIRLEHNDRPKAEIVKLRFFAGLTNKQAAAAMGISESTADRYWAFARAWLQAEMR